MNDIIVALAQCNATVGDIHGNADLVLDASREASAKGAQVVVFPEMTLSGYPPEDLVLKPHFLDDCQAELHSLSQKLPNNLCVIVGLPLKQETARYNAAAVLFNGEICGFYKKMTLPNYGVFDEKRLFSRGNQPFILDINGLHLGLHICEDSWHPDKEAVQSLKRANLDGLLNLSASPYHRRKQEERKSILHKTAEELHCPLLYCNLVGGQDELVFDGGSMVITPKGEITAGSPLFETDILYTRLEAVRSATDNAQPNVSLNIPDSDTVPSVRIAEPMDPMEEIYRALTLGLRDYINKNGFKKAVVALSGGIDSALTASIAVDALGAERVAGITMPSVYSSSETRSDAEELALNLGIKLYTVPIERLQNAYENELHPLWPDRSTDTTEENLQARIRGNIIMALSNKFGWIVLSTGNKSELAVGYCTIYGDMVGGFAILKDVPKTVVFDLSRHRNRTAGKPWIPDSTISRPPSAELRPDQKDTDSLPPYDLLDAILELYVEKDFGIEAIVKAGYEGALVRDIIRMVDRNEYKRRQGAPGIKITPKAFGRDRRVPITNRYQAHL